MNDIFNLKTEIEIEDIFTYFSDYKNNYNKVDKIIAMSTVLKFIIIFSGLLFTIGLSGFL